MRRIKRDLYSVKYTLMSVLAFLALILIIIYFDLTNHTSVGVPLDPTVTLYCRIAAFAYCFLVVVISVISERRSLKIWWRRKA